MVFYTFNIVFNFEWHWLDKLFLTSEQVFPQNSSLWPIVPMAGLCYNAPILMKFAMHIIYKEEVEYT